MDLFDAARYFKPSNDQGLVQAQAGYGICLQEGKEQQWI
jgi:hypothetical protein